MQPEAETNEPSAILPSKALDDENEEMHTETQSVIIDKTLRLNIEMDIRNNRPIKAEVHPVDDWVNEKVQSKSINDDEGKYDSAQLLVLSLFRGLSYGR